MHRWIAKWGIVLSILLVTSCASTGPGPPAGGNPQRAIVVASFDFPESVVVAQLLAVALESHGFKVQRAFELGSREIVEPALQQARVDLVPEYLGSALEFVTLGKARVTSNAARMHSQLARALAPKGVRALPYAPAQDQNAFVVSEQTAARYGLRNISDLEPIASELVFGGPPECEERTFCLKGLRRVYGLQFKSFRSLDVAGPQTVGALESAEVDVALLFSTDPNIISKSFVLLNDDRELQPAENLVPVLRERVLEIHGRGVARVLESVTNRLSTEGLRTLNKRVSLDGVGSAKVAGEWLRTQELIE